MEIGLAMNNTHWLDAFSLTLTRNRHRRELLRAASRLAPGFVLWQTAVASAGGRKKHKKKHKPKPRKTCSKGACAKQWAGDRGEINFCEFICDQCDDGVEKRDFYIDGSDPQDPVARCCEPGTPNFCNGKCTNLQDDKNNCGVCGTTCEAGPGQVCRNKECVCPATCPHGMNCLDALGQPCGGEKNCRCWCGPNFKYCPNIGGGVCASQNAVC
jgi:hypothetical protein